MLGKVPATRFVEKSRLSKPVNPLNVDGIVPERELFIKVRSDLPAPKQESARKHLQDAQTSSIAV